jgi:two-component system sensor histidine kinase AtoS
MYSAEAVNYNLACLSREDDYNEYFENTINGIIHVDSTLRIKNLNREAEKICGVDRSKILGKQANVVFQKYGEKFLRIFSMQDYEDLHTANLKLEINGKIIYVHVDTLKLLDSSGETSGMIVILQDVSAVRVAIKQIQTTQMLMSLGELAAGVAHHVRTPLTTISGYLQVMLNRLEDDRYTVRRDILEMLFGEVSYINSVVTELVLFAKPPIKKEPGIIINNIIEEALLLIFKQLGGEKISIKKQLAANLPYINADSNLLKQAMVNIMQNAMEAMPDVGTLTIKSWINAELNMLVIAIADTGTGVANEILSRVFEPFYTSKLDRMGLGLPIAHRIVAEHGGFINISANEDNGTKVHVYIPIFDDRMRHLTVVHQQVLNLQ